MKTLRTWHVLWLGLTPVLFALFRLTSEPHDSDRVLVDNLVAIAGAVWAGCVAVYFVLTGRREDALPNALKLYRGLLDKPWFLWSTNVLGTLLVLIVAYKLALFRQVELISTRDLEVRLNDKPGQDELVGILRAKTPTSFRLPIGDHALVFRELGTEEVLESAKISVPSLIQEPAKVRHVLAVNPPREYGKAR